MFQSLLLLSLAALALAQQELDGASFAAAIANAKKSSSTLIVDLYAPWCGHCQRFAPVFSSLAAEKPEGLEFAKIDADANGASVEAIKSFSGFPTIWKVSNGKISEFEGDYTNKEELLQWAKQQVARFRQQGHSASKAGHHARVPTGGVCARDEAH